MEYPKIIQGGMGAGVSSSGLARAVSSLGQLGVVSGTALDVSLCRRLQLGDTNGTMRMALAAFPDQALVGRVLERYFIPGGKPEGTPFKLLPAFTQHPDLALLELTVAANFVEVHLAKRGHPGVVGINYLEKIQFPNLASIYGAMLAGVDYVLMGAGIPREIPAVLDTLALRRAASLRMRVEGEREGSEHRLAFDPAVLALTGGELKRPIFLAIVASSVLAANLARKADGKVDGFVVEGPTAGGHNAPPRGKPELTAQGEPRYGERDKVDLAAMRALGRPFWLAGSFGRPERLVEALGEGAQGIQAGTAFAFCQESGLTTQVKARVFELARQGRAPVRTSATASPTGFPFKVVQWEESLSREDTYRARRRICDLGYLRTAYQKPDGSLGYRCASEPVEAYLAKGGRREDTEGRRCLCNALMSNIGLAQNQKWGYEEEPLVTAGDDLAELSAIFGNEGVYSAAQVVGYLLGVPAAPAPGQAPAPVPAEV